MTATPIPGRLPVEYDAGLGPIVKPLDQVPTGASIEVTATIGSCKSLAGGRVALVLTDGRDTAMVSIDSAVFMAASRTVGTLIESGQVVVLRGAVARRHPTMTTIDGRSIRPVHR